MPTLACYETANFNTSTCAWVVTGTQAAMPTLACYQTATFNTTSCAWDVTGTQAAMPTLACYQTATFNTTSCAWVVTGSQPAAPTGLACYETATFNTTSCSWNVTGTQPVRPTTACYETATFNSDLCIWEIFGSAPNPIITTISACDSYTFFGQNYSSSGSYTIWNGCAIYVLDLTITTSSNHSTTVQAEGFYMWNLNGVTYTVSGNYSLVSNCHTEILELTIVEPPAPSLPPPSISIQPVDGTICAGNNIDFISGADYDVNNTVKWQRSVDNGSTWDDINSGIDAGTTYSGFTTETLSITGSTASMNGYMYQAVFTNLNGSNSTNAATLTVNTVPAASIASSNGLVLNCNILSTTLTASSGSSYSWSTGASTAAINVSSIGTYTVVVTSANGCTSAAVKTITQDLSIPTGTISNTNGLVLTCSATNTILSSTGGTAYLWSTGDVTPAISVSAAGTYTLVTTGTNGCTSTQSVTVSYDVSLPNVSINNNTSTSELNCNIGSISLTASGGASYSWSNGLGNNPSIMINNPGTYVVTAYASNGCSSTSQVVITKNIQTPNITIANNTGTTEINCTTTNISVTATGGSSYVWTNQGSSISSIANLTITAPGHYKVTGTGANGCIDTAGIDISSGFALPVIVTQPSLIARKVTLNLIPPAYTVAATGSGVLTYQWYKNANPENFGGTPVVGAISASYVPSTSVVSSYYYYVVVSNSNGCSINSQITGFITVCGP
jgi:hypothetical protein